MSGRGKGRQGALAPPNPSLSGAIWAEVTNPGNVKLAFHGGVFLFSIYVFREVSFFNSSKVGKETDALIVDSGATCSSCEELDA
jgi:hypothetical protein